MAENLDAVITDLKGGKGLAGKILTDTSLANNLNETMLKIKQVGMEADALVAELGKVAGTISADVNRGKGPLSVLLRDSALVIKLNTSLDNIEKGTEGFNQNMEALKHNFLLRGYFKKQEKKKRKEEAGSTAKDH